MIFSRLGSIFIQRGYMAMQYMEQIVPLRATQNHRALLINTKSKTAAGS